eukprot:scaffold54322_cov74-Phaeocystis_antarctica.AAC.11
MSTLGLDGVSADLAGQDAPRQRTFSRILGDAMPPRPPARQSHLSALAGHAVHSFHAKRSAAWPDLADLLPALRRSQCRSMLPDGDAFISIYPSPGLAHRRT